MIKTISDSLNNNQGLIGVIAIIVTIIGICFAGNKIIKKQKAGNNSKQYMADNNSKINIKNHD